MGLDISIGVNNGKEVFTEEYYDEEDNYYKHSLSRTFCNFIWRRNMIEGEPELEQIGRITGIDITPIYDMEKYWGEYGIEMELSVAETPEAKQQAIERIREDNDSLTGNINKVYQTVTLLIDKLSLINNLPQLLAQTDYDTLGIEEYFSDFDVDKGEGYIGNNFGQDLRNFKRFLEYAKARGAQTVYFTYD